MDIVEPFSSPTLSSFLAVKTLFSIARRLPALTLLQKAGLIHDKLRVNLCLQIPSELPSGAIFSQSTLTSVLPGSRADQTDVVLLPAGANPSNCCMLRAVRRVNGYEPKPLRKALEKLTFYNVQPICYGASER